MYNKRTLMGLMAMACALEGSNGHYRTRAVREPNPKPKKSIAEINKNLGLQEFSYGENKVWALNKTNADRKAKKLGWTL